MLREFRLPPLLVPERLIAVTVRVVRVVRVVKILLARGRHRCGHLFLSFTAARRRNLCGHLRRHLHFEVVPHEGTYRGTLCSGGGGGGQRAVAVTADVTAARLTLDHQSLTSIRHTLRPRCMLRPRALRLAFTRHEGRAGRRRVEPVDARRRQIADATADIHTHLVEEEIAELGDLQAQNAHVFAQVVDTQPAPLLPTLGEPIREPHRHLVVSRRRRGHESVRLSRSVALVREKALACLLVEVEPEDL